MNKLNACGMDILEYKKQLLNKDYPDIVKKSLEFSVDSMCEGLGLEADINLAVKDSDVSLKEFELNLLSREKYIKSKEELFKEYEVIKKTFMDSLRDLDSDALSDIDFNSDVDSENILLVKRVDIDRAFVKEYFNIFEYDEPDEDKEKEILDKLMKRGGFVEKFAVLRLPKILKDFSNLDLLKSQYFTHEISETYYDEREETNEEIYSIDFILKVNIDMIEDMIKEVEPLEEVINVLKELSNIHTI